MSSDVRQTYTISQNRARVLWRESRCAEGCSFCSRSLRKFGPTLWLPRCGVGQWGRQYKTAEVESIIFYQSVEHMLVKQSIDSSGKIIPPPSTETPEHWKQRMQWWHDAHFGMFIHFGLYSGLEGEYKGKPVTDGGAEWYQEHTGLDSQTYEKMAVPKFQPSEDATDVWTDVAKAAGCEYVVLTSKHHEGFGLFGSKYGNFNAKEVLGRDIVREYIDSCRQKGLGVGLYHSLIDWKHPQYDSRSAPSMPYPEGEAKRTEDIPRDHNVYLEYLHDQVGELLTNYGKVDILWFDFSHFSFEGDEAWKATSLLSKVKSLQPEIIVNNRLFRRPEAGASGDGTSEISPTLDPRYGDFITPEQYIPTTGIPINWEACETLNHTWGYSKFDHDFKSSEELIQTLCSVVSRGGNFLLNIGPKGDGSVDTTSLDRMKAIGKWLDVYNESIKGTKASPFDESFDWGVITIKGSVMYLHIFKLPEDGVITLPLKSKEVVNAYYIEGGKNVIASEKDDGLELNVQIEKLPNVYCSVVKVIFDSSI